jgi:dynein heavy chain
LHRFLASLTDTTHKMEGVTVLYIPKEGADLTPEQASKNKDLVQRLESKYIYYFYYYFQTKTNIYK